MNEKELNQRITRVKLLKVNTQTVLEGFETLERLNESGGSLKIIGLCFESDDDEIDFYVTKMDKIINTLKSEIKLCNSEIKQYEGFLRRLKEEGMK